MVTISDNFLKIASFNIRYSPFNPTSQVGNQAHFSGNAEAPWPTRLPLILDQIKWELPDIVGFQEVLVHQYKDLKDSPVLARYTSVGVGRDDGATRGEYVPIFWRSDKFQSLGVEHFWLSDDPDIPGSIGWDAGQTRMVTLVHLQPTSWLSSSDQKEPSDQSFYVMNTHFDDRGSKARAESAKLILKRSNKLIIERNRPVILIGDLNAHRSESPYKCLTGIDPEDLVPQPRHLFFKDSGSEVERPYGAYTATFTGFNNKPGDAQVIDFIMLMSTPPMNWKAIQYGVIPNQFQDEPRASDHRMVCAVISTGT